MAAHWEAETHLDRWLTAVRAKGVKAGVAVNPSTPVELLVDVLHLCDFVLVMSVNPGFGGQTFLPASLAKVRAVRRLLGARPAEVSVDGGVKADNAGALAAHGASILVAGSAVFEAADVGRAVQALRSAAQVPV